MQVYNPPPKMVSFSQLTSVKKDPIFSAARKIFAPSYFVTALLDLDSVHNARKLLNINLLSHFCQFLNSNLRYTVLMYTRGCQLGFSQKWPQFCKFEVSNGKNK